jgi:hypothetical protein
MTGHAPSTAADTVTVAAVTVLSDAVHPDEPAAASASGRAETHDPTLMSLALAATVLVIFVAPL